MPVTRFRIAGQNAIREVLTSLECSWAVLLINLKRSFPELKDRTIRFVTLDRDDGLSSSGSKISDAKVFWQIVSSLYDASCNMFVIYDDHSVDLNLFTPSIERSFDGLKSFNFKFYCPLTEIIQTVLKQTPNFEFSNVNGLLMLDINSKVSIGGPFLSDDEFWTSYLRSNGSGCYSLNVVVLKNPDEVLASPPNVEEIPPVIIPAVSLSASDLAKKNQQVNSRTAATVSEAIVANHSDVLFNLLFCLPSNYSTKAQVTVAQSMTWDDVKIKVSKALEVKENVKHFILVDSDGDDFSSSLDTSEKFWKIVLKYCKPIPAVQKVWFKTILSETVVSVPFTVDNHGLSRVVETNAAASPSSKQKIDAISTVKSDLVSSTDASRTFQIQLENEWSKKESDKSVIKALISVKSGAAWDFIIDAIVGVFKLPTGQCISYLSPVSSSFKPLNNMICTRTQFWAAVRTADENTSEIAFSVHIYPNTTLPDNLFQSETKNVATTGEIIGMSTTIQSASETAAIDLSTQKKDSNDRLNRKPKDLSSRLRLISNSASSIPLGFLGLSCALASAPNAVATAILKSHCSWNEVVGAVAKALCVDKGVIDCFIFVDHEGSQISAKLTTSDKLWLANTSEDYILHVLTKDPDGPEDKPADVLYANDGKAIDVKRVLSFSFHKDQNLTGTIYFEVVPSWHGFKTAIAERFNIINVDCITHVIIVDAEGDELSGKVNTDSKLGKFFQHREIEFKVYTNEAPQLKVPNKIFHAELSSNPDICGDVIVSQVPTWVEMQREIIIALKMRKTDVISHIIFVDSEGDELSGNVNTDLKISKFLNQFIGNTTVRIKVFAAVDTNKSAVKDALLLYCASENIAELNKLAAKVTDVDDVDANTSLSAFLLSCQAGKMSSVKWLLQHNANINQKSPNGNTGLHLAILNKHDELVQLLVASGGINIFSLADNGLSPFLCAASCGNIFAWKLLSRRGAKLSEFQKSTGYRAIHLAAVNDEVDLLSFLIQEGSVGVDDLDLNGSTALLDAAAHGKLAAAELLKSCGANVKFIVASGENRGATALHFACKYGHINIVSWLMQFGLAFDVNDARGNTAMHLAKINNHDAIVTFLLDTEIMGVDSETDLDLTVFRRLVDLGIFERAKKYLDTYMKSIEFEFNEEKSNALFQMAAACGHDTVVEYLVMQGVDVNAINSQSGKTAFMEACAYNQLSMAKYLLERGANINKRDNMGQSPLQIASALGHHELVSWLKSVSRASVTKSSYRNQQRLNNYKKSAETVTSAFSSIFSCVSEQVEELVDFEIKEKEMDVSDTKMDATFEHSNRTTNNYPSHGLSASGGPSAALHSAVRTKASMDLISVLADIAISDIDSVDEDGYTALYIAADESYAEAVFFLLERGADPSAICDLTGDTPLHAICKNGDKKILQRIIDMQHDRKTLQDVDLGDLYDVNSYTLLHTATMVNHRDIVQILVEQAFVDKNASAAGNRTALILAAMNRCTAVGLYLIDQGCDVSFRDAVGGTAILYAAKSGDLDLIQYLVLKGASLTDRTESGNGIMHIACQVGSLDMIRWLFSKDAPINIKNIQGKSPYQYAVEYKHNEIVEFFQALKIQGHNIS